MLLRRDNPRPVPDVSQFDPDAEGWTLATRLTDIREFPRSGADLDDDKSLVLAFQSGDIDAYSDIFVKYRALSAKICYRILQDREEADEAVQETMLRVYRGLGTFNGRYQLQAWVARIATNVSLDMVRARARRPQRDPAMPDISEDRRSDRRADRGHVRGGRAGARSGGDPHHPVLDPGPSPRGAGAAGVRGSFARGDRRGPRHVSPAGQGADPPRQEELPPRLGPRQRAPRRRRARAAHLAGAVPAARVPAQAVAARPRRGGQRHRDGATGGRPGDRRARGRPGRDQHGRQGDRGRASPSSWPARSAWARSPSGTRRSRRRPPRSARRPPRSAAAPAIVVAAAGEGRSRRSSPTTSPSTTPDDPTTGDQDQTGVVPVDTPESPAPTDPSPTPGPVSPPPPPPPAPAWTGAFTTSGGIAAATSRARVRSG